MTLRTKQGQAYSLQTKQVFAYSKPVKELLYQPAQGGKNSRGSK